ncbi:MAG: D-alanyl-D-alanine carboxypeptidase [Lachnospiraceae bacterium]|nr:D-alanyl-D-alanine carboxypeptidase [Lachnospiraceae bacterium]
MKRISTLLLALILVFQLAVMPVFAQSGGAITDLHKASGGDISLEAKSAILMDAGTGEILYSKNIHSKRYPASITKIMTTLVAIENCDSLYDTVTYSQHAIDSIEPGSSQIYIEPGEKLSLEESLYAIMLESANEACNGVAEHIGGSIEGFVDMMNKRAEEIGCKDTHFMNPNGLHNDKHYVSAYDMAIITRTALQNETFRKIASTVSYTIPVTNKCKQQRPLWNHHKMVKRTMYTFDGVEGGKTGFTMMARNTLVTWCKRDGVELICVVLRSNNPGWYEDTYRLLSWGYNNYKAYAPFAQEFTPKTVDTSGLPVFLRDHTPSISISGDENYSILMNKNTKGSKVKTKVAIEDGKNKLEFYYKGDKIGSTKFKVTFHK